ncbi:hypothetical protein [Nostoc sp.]|uniref:hypothetical protein n=1 Tax=Nostoc sp. TaxID=1180 RepID=UPI003FA55AAC
MNSITYQGIKGFVLGVDFSADGQWIVSSSIDRTVKLWKQDGTLVRTINTTYCNHTKRSLQPR